MMDRDTRKFRFAKWEFEQGNRKPMEKLMAYYLEDTAVGKHIRECAEVLGLALVGPLLVASNTTPPANGGTSTANGDDQDWVAKVQPLAQLLAKEAIADEQEEKFAKNWIVDQIGLELGIAPKTPLRGQLVAQALTAVEFEYRKARS